MAKKKQKADDNTIIVNKKARHDYFIQETFEAGIMLQGWEVKSLRATKVQLRDSYVKIINNEAVLIGALISPLPTVSQNTDPNPSRTRKLLLHRAEISKFIGLIERKGFTLVATKMYWARGNVKVQIGLAKGKKDHDKRATIKEREWQREKGRILKDT